MRFGKVFQQTYTRFLDLQKAEAQAREAKIEASLERTRTQSMLMQHSNELDNTLRVFHEQVLLLGIHSAFSFLWLPDEDKERHIFWAAWAENVSIDPLAKKGSVVFKSKAINYPLDRNEPATAQCLIDWKGKESVVSYHVPPAGVESYFAAWQELIAGVEQLKPEHFSDGLFYVEAFMKYCCFGVMIKNEMTEEEKKILGRFAIEFERAYTRFLDLQKAEAQAREAQIENALEKVRSRTMAMQRSEELPEAANNLFLQVQLLGIPAWSAGYCIWDEDKQGITFWMSSEGVMQSSAHAPCTDDPSFIHMREACERGDAFHVEELGGEALVTHYKYMRTLPVVGEILDSIIAAGHPLPTFQIFHCVYFSQGFLLFITYEPVPEAHNIFKRFTNVFEQTYTRFLDLKNAEAQTHKAKIETALERVRARALAMQQPEELKEVAEVLRHEMGLLGVEELETCSIYINDENAEKAECWYALKDLRATEKKLVNDHFELDLNDTWVGREMLKFYRLAEKQISIVMQGVNRKEWINYCEEKSVPFRGYYGEVIPDRTYHLYKFSHGAIGAAAAADISAESWDLLSRAASVFSLAYSRFKDLTKARFDLQQLKEEKKRSDSLLLNILPADIAAELKQFGKSYARKHEQVSILFTDIKGFSTISETLSAEELVNQLDECFRAFDHIVGKHGLEKIKTIGDAYICACGLPNPDPDNAVKTVRAAIDMLDFAKGFGMTKIIQDLPAFEFRVGIHTGPVITGVVGLKKFTYDIWGDAVNMAARMEQHGEAGRINVSGNTYQLIKDKFICTHRGKILAKNKGEVDMYFVEKASI